MGEGQRDPSPLRTRNVELGRSSDKRRGRGGGVKWCFLQGEREFEVTSLVVRVRYVYSSLFTIIGSTEQKENRRKKLNYLSITQLRSVTVPINLS